MNVSFRFVPYGEVLFPEKNTVALDVGLKTVPGVIDHHHPEAEPECTASLLVKYPELVLNHISVTDWSERPAEKNLLIITHRLPDFDAIASIYITLQLLEKGEVDDSLKVIAAYTKLADSGSLPKAIDLTATPYSILRALFSAITRDGDEGNYERVQEGLRFFRFLGAKIDEGYEIMENRALFTAVDRYEKAIRRIEEDYFNYLTDLHRATKVTLYLPLVHGQGKMAVDGLICRHPKSFLLKEWARRDRSNSPQARGFGFLLTVFGNQRYIMGVDPEIGVNLRGLGDWLNQKEEEKRKASNRPFPFRWYDGNCPFFNFRIIDSPQDGPSLSYQEILDLILKFGSR